MNIAHAKTNTIQFITPDPLVQFGPKGTLHLTSNQTAGLHKYLNPKELGVE